MGFLELDDVCAVNQSKIARLRFILVLAPHDLKHYVGVLSTTCNFSCSEGSLIAGVEG